jgi:RNA polymerase sigma-70 factor, ECF subfamily
MGLWEKIAPPLEYGLSATSDRPFAVEERDRARERQAKQVNPREQVLTVYDEYRPRLFRYLRSMGLGRDRAEEVIQETFMRLTAELLQEVDIQNLQGWVVRVAHNQAVDMLTKLDRDRIGIQGEIALENHADPALSPEEVYAKKEQLRRMELALAKLNPQQRQCFQMRVQGFRYKDIGVALAISEQRAAFVMKQVAVRLAAICG